jgi:hypothetical protein
MLGKYRLRPSFLLEVAFLVVVWLVAWRVFNPPVAVLVFIIFAAYGLVFIYENWLDSVSRRERAEARRLLRKESQPEPKFSAPRQRPGPPASAGEPSAEEPAVAGHSISERLSAKLHGRETEGEVAAVPPEIAAPDAPPGPVPSAASGPIEAPPERIEGAETRMQESQAEPPKRDEPAPPVESAPRSVSEAVSEPRSEPAPAAERKPDRPHSLMAEIAAGPEARKSAHTVGGWNVWQLERLLGAQAKPDPERDLERSMLLVYLREFADSDGQLPPDFDDLVRESFADLMHGPAS